MGKRTEKFPIGWITVTAVNGVVISVAIDEKKYFDADAAAENALQQLHEYFNGTRKKFDFPVSYPIGTPFQREVWNALQTIPYGETVSYQDLAVYIGRPNASRAVGSAIGKNPLLLVNPCHRVIASNGTIGGFAYGTDTKIQLLQLEKKYREEFL